MTVADPPTPPGASRPHRRAGLLTLLGRIVAGVAVAAGGILLAREFPSSMGGEITDSNSPPGRPAAPTRSRSTYRASQGSRLPFRRL